MDELYMQWQELVDSGECDCSFESWYSSLIDKAHDYIDLER